MTHTIEVYVHVRGQFLRCVTDTGYGSTVTLPKLDIPIHVPREVLVSLYVGRTILDYGLEVYKASAEWQKTQRTNDESQSPPAPAQTTEDGVEPF